VTNNFDITHKLNCNRNQEIGQLMGRIMETVVGVTTGTCTLPKKETNKLYDCVQNT